MPEKRTTERARRKLRQGKSPSTAAGEFVREEIEHVREGKHGPRAAKQAIAIGLSKARRAGVPLARKKGVRVGKPNPPPKRPQPGPRRPSARRSQGRAHAKGFAMRKAETGGGRRTCRRSAGASPNRAGA
jgi:hypothetical protein